MTEKRGSVEGIERARILVCVSDPPDHALTVLQAAHRLAEALVADLYLLHVATESVQLRERLEPALVETGIPFHSLTIAEGEPAVVICRTAREIGASLIVAGALRREGIVRDLVGSTARTIARKAPCSVFLVVRPFEYQGPWPRIVASLSFNESDVPLMEAVVAIARLHEQPLVHVVHESQTYSNHIDDTHSFGDASWRKYRQANTAEERYLLANLLEGLDLEGININAISLTGMPIREVLRYAEESSANLLALNAPARRLRFLDRFFRHPIEIVLDKLPCSLLIVRTTNNRRT